MPDFGVIYVAYGERAQDEARLSIASLRRVHRDWPVLVITDAPAIRGADHVINFHPSGWGARRAKLHCDQLAPWDRFLYLDADTRVHGDLSAGFEALAGGWDVAITASENQETRRLWHVSEEDRALTLMENPVPLQLQGGVFWCTKNERTRALFQAWREEWATFENYDQGALLRALYRSPVRVWIVGRTFNGRREDVIEHRFGRARAA